MLNSAENISRYIAVYHRFEGHYSQFSHISLFLNYILGLVDFRLKDLIIIIVQMALKKLNV